MSDPVFLIASGDLRLSANQKCWPAQESVEASVIAAIRNAGRDVRRAHPFDSAKQHGFIDSQKYGMRIFRDIPRTAPLLVVEAVWQYSHHVLHGLFTHQGPILTVANWSGEWPGLVGMLNLNGSLTKAGVRYETLWSKDFKDSFFLTGLQRWLNAEPIAARRKPRTSANEVPIARRGRSARARHRGNTCSATKPFSECSTKAAWGCTTPSSRMNCCIPPACSKNASANRRSLPKCSARPDSEAQAVRDWLDKSGMKFVTGPNPETDLVDQQILDQCKMYIAALRIADDFGCDAIGIQYQQGLKDLTPASDLAEGLLNNVERPPVLSHDGRELYAGHALPHFNEVDECAGLDALITNRIWTKLGFDPETTLHDIRYGEEYNGEFVWVFEISGAAPPKHFIDEYKGTVSERQPPMYFRLGGGTVKGISKPGEIVWSRIFVDHGKLKADLGRAAVRELPFAETERRWRTTTPQWPIMHAVTYGITRDQMMARHKSNHIQVAYAPNAESANRALAAKAATFRNLGLDVTVCGTNNGLVQ